MISSKGQIRFEIRLRMEFKTRKPSKIALKCFFKKFFTSLKHFKFFRHRPMPIKLQFSIPDDPSDVKNSFEISLTSSKG